ncbi:phosphoenolpyruvate--protein phosphotransferase [Salinibius halmophilus]|uniref:phosphoenolpyruvate--protein phosphotransferase n=1 Tax=Salinibius halmophilus TaxID=1853216 RepID=UPI0018F5F6A8|nr:phosphoenolpyruvate--protein phosphotransferase [Salinibius halmophilus]
MAQQNLALHAPLTGVYVAIANIPDPVFAEKMVGDGCAIDPTSNLLVAPFDGTVTQLHDAKHAVAITHASGIEVLLHIGLDSVALKGQGFKTKVALNQQVKTGEPLIEFDADYIATHAQALMTEIIITNSDQVERFEFTNKALVQQGETLFSMTLASAANTADASAVAEHAESASTESATVVLPNPQGLHARPAAVLVEAVKKSGCQVTLTRGDNTAKANSVVALMGLGTKRADHLVLTVTGSDAAKHLADIKGVIDAGLGESFAPLTEAELAAPVAAPAVEVTQETPLIGVKEKVAGQLAGVAAAPGLAIGEAFWLQTELPEYPATAADSAAQAKRLKDAITQSDRQLEQLIADNAGKSQAEIFTAHRGMLADDDLSQSALAALQSGASAEAAFAKAIDAQVQILTATNDPLLAGRAADLRDLEGRVLKNLLGVAIEVTYPANCVVVAKDLTPSVTASLDTDKVLGFVTEVGGASSHSAIIARALGLPAIAGLGSDIADIKASDKLMIDGQAGTVRINPSSEQVDALLTAKKAREAKLAQAEQAASEPANLKDGRHIEVMANIATAADAAKGLTKGADGSGLLRTEFLFQDRQTAPTEDEQFDSYREILAAMPGKPIIIRTLDVGGDKPLSYLPLPEEENPFLGERGIRIGLNRPSILRTQVRAILRAHAKCGNAKIMFPMIARVEELVAAKAVVLEEAQNLGVQACDVGIMIEVPSAAMIADQLAEHAEFFSVGSNDLTQYVLAMDRGHPKMAAFADGLEPAVLRMIAQAVKGAQKHGRWVGVCGGIASDPEAVPVLIGLGVTELSCSVPVIPEIRAIVRQLDEATCSQVANAALVATDAKAVRALAAKVIG